MGGNGEIVQAQEAPGLAELIKDLSPVEVLMCVLVAEYEKAENVFKGCTERFGDDSITMQRIWHITSPVHRPQKFHAIIDAMRAMWGVSLDEPILNPAWRMRQRRRIVEKAIKGSQFDQAREALSDVERLIGNLRADGHGPATAIQINVGGNGVGDLNRAPETDQEAEAWRQRMLAEMDAAHPGGRAGGNGDGQAENDVETP